jgi:hypothetical protein
MASPDFTDELDLGERLKRELSLNLPSFRPGNLIAINPKCCKEKELISVFYYLDIEDVNDKMGMESAEWLNSWVTTGNTLEFHKRIFLFLYETTILLNRSETIEILPIAVVLDNQRILNIPLFMLSDARNTVYNHITT